MLKDNGSIISTIQLAVIGVILVVGFFFIWRMISRVEEKVDDLLIRSDAAGRAGASAAAAAHYPMFHAPLTSEIEPMADEDADDADDADGSEFEENARIFMTQVFGGSGPLGAAAAAATAAPPQVSIIEEESVQESTVGAVGLSKSKIRKMNLDALREACREHHLPEEGTRAQLTERLLALLE